ncbi:MAG: hypothetical protein KKB25_01055 [Nanoarchaeota archaeon]|nr:hypothetical protein [Nanoarchaeota archaeon]
MADSKILRMLREDLIGEFNAINQYQQHIDGLSGEAKKTLGHIIADEKEHAAELAKLIRKLDAAQDEKFRKEGM